MASLRRAWPSDEGGIVRTMTLLFFAAVLFLLGAVAWIPAQTMIGGYQREGDSQLLYGVCGYMLSIVAIAGPIAFLAAAVASSLRRE